mgnify:CR=1 FL=1
MATITAQLSNYTQSPRKVRLVADLVRGKSVEKALVELTFLNKRAAAPFKKFIESAIANAEHNFKAKKEDLLVKEIRVDKGVVMKRFMPRAFGRAYPIRKRMSHLKLVLETKAESK